MSDSVVIPTYLRGKTEDQMKAPTKELYLQYDPYLAKTVWAFKYPNKKGKATVYRAKDDSESERVMLQKILDTGKIEGRGNIYHPKNRTFRMPIWLGRYKFLGKGYEQSS